MNSVQHTFMSRDERHRLVGSVAQLRALTHDIVSDDDVRRVRAAVIRGIGHGCFDRDRFGFNPLLHNLDTAILLSTAVSPDRNMTIAILLFNLMKGEAVDEDQIAAEWGEDIARLVHGLLKVNTLYSRQVAVHNENFRKLLLAFAEDIRVIIIMLVDRLTLMRAVNHHPDEKAVRDLAFEAGYLYAPLAHRLGLYAIKSELEDLTLKYQNRKVYTDIARQLNQTKSSREAYIADFIAPLRAKLDATGLKYEIKGRTKSIYSIWNKIKKQHNDLDHIYDLFAIRIIIDAEPIREKSDCWLAYSVVTDLYTPNPSRMKDWISIPKSNGYESLHVTVYGPQERWVEVQIRTRRMDLIAEKGLAAHWRYKGIKSEGALDTWMNNIRDILETAESGPMELMKNMRMDVYDKEVFVFSPKGDLYRLPFGATLLDFAFAVHTRLGMACVGGRVNDRNQKLNYRLQNGDTVSVNTSTTQVPKLDWLNFTVTSKARNKIRQSVKEMENRASSLGREFLERRFKNRHIELQEAALMKVIKKLGYKTVTDFFREVGEERLDINRIVAEYDAVYRQTNDTSGLRPAQSAADFQLQTADTDDQTSSDVLVIGGPDLKGMNYRLAKCCNPIYGDDVFGFVSAEGVVKVHRRDCPNAPDIHRKYPYRIIHTRWSGKLGEQLGATLRIVGVDDIGIVTNITSIINKEKGAQLRNISIDSHDGIFHGYLVVGVADRNTLSSIIRNLKTVKGVKDVQRSN